MVFQVIASRRVSRNLCVRSQHLASSQRWSLRMPVAMAAHPVSARSSCGAFSVWISRQPESIASFLLVPSCFSCEVWFNVVSGSALGSELQRHWQFYWTTEHIGIWLQSGEVTRLVLLRVRIWAICENIDCWSIDSQSISQSINQSINIRLFDVKVISQQSKCKWDLQRRHKMLEASFWGCRLVSAWAL